MLRALACSARLLVPEIVGASLQPLGRAPTLVAKFAGGKSRTVFALPAAEREEHAIRGLAGDAAHLYWLHEEKGVERLAL